MDQGNSLKWEEDLKLSPSYHRTQVTEGHEKDCFSDIFNRSRETVHAVPFGDEKVTQF